MSFQVPTNFVEQFNANVSILTQQTSSKLSGYVRHESFTGKKTSFDRIGPTDVVERAGRHADTVLIGTPHDRRWANARTFDWADLIDDVDKLKMLYDPKSPYARNAAMAFARKKDRLIIDAALGDCYTGEEGDTLVEWATAGSDQIIAHGSAGLTIAKLLEARELAMEAEIPDETKWVMVVSPKQVTTLLNTTEVKDADYNTVKALAAGHINTFMGFEFIWSTMLPIASSIRSCIAFAQDGITLAKQADVTTRISDRPDKNHSTQIFVTMTMNAVRMEEERVIEIECDES